ncbi:MAG: hypothetical protein KGZ83_22600 [Sulfuricella sp.]|nr:hypothetical protein [Sulfuricella sp.]
MLKIVMLLAGVLVVYLLLTKHKRGTPRTHAEAPKQMEDMVRCAHCAVYLPKNESIPSGEQYFCCEDHRRLGRPR